MYDIPSLVWVALRSKDWREVALRRQLSGYSACAVCCSSLTDIGWATISTTLHIGKFNLLLCCSSNIFPKYLDRYFHQQQKVSFSKLVTKNSKQYNFWVHQGGVAIQSKKHCLTNFSGQHTLSPKLTQKMAIFDDSNVAKKAIFSVNFGKLLIPLSLDKFQRNINVSRICFCHGRNTLLGIINS